LSKSAKLLGRRSPVTDALALQNHWAQWMSRTPHRWLRAERVPNDY
jgi:hypothetical protein